MSKQGRRVILIYKAHMYNEASPDPEKCTHKSDEKARRSWLLTHLRQIDQYEEINNPIGVQQEDDTMEEAKADAGQPTKTELPPMAVKHMHLQGAQVHNSSRINIKHEDIGGATPSGGHPSPLWYCRTADNSVQGSRRHGARQPQ